MLFNFPITSDVETEAKAPEAAVFYESRSGSGKSEMNGSEAEPEVVKKILEAETEAIEILNFHCFHSSGIWGKVFLSTEIFLEIEPNLQESGSERRSGYVWSKRGFIPKQWMHNNFKVVEAEAEAANF